MPAPLSPFAARRARRAFSLLEVVAAVGIFSIAMVAIIGMFAPVARSVSGVGDAEAAANVGNVLTSKLQSLTIAGVAPLLKTSSGANRHQLTDVDNNPNSAAADPRTDKQLLFASRDGTKIGSYNDAIWARSDVDKFFEIALIRNETLLPLVDPKIDPAPVDPVTTTHYLPYTARIRWPAFVIDPTPTNSRGALPAGFNSGGTVRFDNSLKQVLFVTGVVTR
jgi:prepilin-type N-terminal cleavage/methylation domain-containing protein